VRIDKLREEFGSALEVEWKSFLLRPRGEPGRSLDKFRAYTRAWMKAAAQEDSGEFNVWSSDEGPPANSFPPHLLAKAAASLGEDAFAAIHARLWPAYFRDSRDITTPQNLLDIWRDAGLPDAEFTRVDDPELAKRVIDEHNEAVQMGASGVPAFRMADNEAVITGAHPLDLFRRWIGRALEASD
jgi:predicted DsbA family dithiol-disulfide isomerase